MQLQFKLHSILIILDLLITIRDNLTCLQRKQTSWAQRETTLEKKTFHSRTKENRLVI